MKVINMDRGEGKTTFLVALSAEHNIPIVAMDPHAVQAVADRIGVKIPKPMSVKEAMNAPHMKVLVDEVNHVAARALNKTIVTCTITEKDELFCERYCRELNYYDNPSMKKSQH